MQLLKDKGPEWVDGFKAAGFTAGIKDSGNPDLGILICEKDADCFGAFTRNRVVAAPVVYSRQLLKNHSAFRGVVVNSGNANACTGQQGYENTRKMGRKAAKALGLPSESLLVCSTGVIGHQLPMDIILSGLEPLAEKVQKGEATDFAKSILTTDTREKMAAIELELAGQKVRIAGCSKGSGMIHPDMATMLAFVTTNLELPWGFRDEFLEIINASFNSITVDGDTSTNDTSLLFAARESGIRYEDLNSSEKETFRKALFDVFAELAKEIVRDGEGATKFVEYRIRNAVSVEQARRIGRFVANSKLVKTALFGNDPNWGRLLSSLGASGEEIDPNRVSISYDTVDIFRKGEPANPNEDELEEIAKKDEFTIIYDLDEGSAEARVWSCDLSYEYVRINAEYTT